MKAICLISVSVFSKIGLENIVCYMRQFLLKDTFRIILQINVCLLLNENGQLFPFSSKLPANLQPTAVPRRDNQSWEGARWLPFLLDDFWFAFPLIAKFCIQLVNL